MEVVRTHRRQVHLVGTDKLRRGIAGKPICDAAPPTRTATCHFVLPCGRGVGNARCAHHSIRARTVYTRVSSTHARPVPARRLLFAAQRRCELSPAALLCDPLKERALGVRGVSLHAASTRAETDRACHTDCLDCCYRPTHLPPPLASRKLKLRGRLETSWGKPAK